jgi:hypothetical protein
MQRVLEKTDVLKELADVTDKLGTRGVAVEKRLVLLRRQAQLGDDRDAIAQRERRARSRRAS